MVDKAIDLLLILFHHGKYVHELTVRPISLPGLSAYVQPVDKSIRTTSILHTNRSFLDINRSTTTTLIFTEIISFCGKYPEL